MRAYLFAFLAVISAGLVPAEAALETAFETGLQRADGLAREGQVDSALAAYRALSDSQPDSAVVHTRMGGMLLLKRQYAWAIRSFQVAIGLDPENSGEAFVGLGLAYLHLGQYGPASAALTQARRLKPGSAADLDQLVAWLDGRASAPEDSQR
jgi:Flp pilus assembly protein TadD